MLTSRDVENFKRIAAHQRIEFAALTLLLGANSAGESALLLALRSSRELIERGTAEGR